MAHLGQYYYPTDNEKKHLPGYFSKSGLVEHLGHLFLGVLFWYFLSQASLNGSKRGAYIATPILTALTYFVVPERFGFSFVNAVLIIMFSISSLMREHKDGWYDLYALTVSFPIALVGWIEGYFCLDFVRSIGGHVIYDGWICIGQVIFLLLALNYSETKVKES